MFTDFGDGLLNTCNNFRYLMFHYLCSLLYQIILFCYNIDSEIKILFNLKETVLFYHMQMYVVLKASKLSCDFLKS